MDKPKSLPLPLMVPSVPPGSTLDTVIKVRPGLTVYRVDNHWTWENTSTVPALMNLTAADVIKELRQRAQRNQVLGTLLLEAADGLSPPST